jgi:hypothetical protein
MEVRTGYRRTRTGRLKRVDYVVPAERGVETPEGDNKDCVIRAVCNVTGLSRDHVAQVAEAYGRVHGRGCCPETVMNVLRAFNMTLRATCGTTIMVREYSRIADKIGISYRRCEGMTIARALFQMQHGKWVVLRRGHAFAVVNGKIIDKTPNSPDASVVAIFRAPD